jgi:magnesium transporter
MELNRPTEVERTGGSTEHACVDDVRRLLGAFAPVLADGDEASVRALAAHEHAADMADALQRMADEDRDRVIDWLGPAFDAEILSYLEPKARREAVRRFNPAQLAGLIDALDSDDAVDLVDSLDEPARADTLRLLNPAVRSAVLEGLSFPEETAGRLMQKLVFAVPVFWTVGKTIDYLRAAPEGEIPEEFLELFVVDAMMRVVGTLALHRLLRRRRSERIADFYDPDVDRIPVDMAQEDVALLFRRYGLVAAPVVDDEGRLLGVITVDDVVEVIDEAVEEDLFKLSGLSEGEALERGIWETTRARVGWLSVNLLTAVAASAVIGLFQGTIEQVVALAVLMPIVASMGGNAGTQTLTIAVRGIATRTIGAHNGTRIVARECLVGLINGAVFAALGALVVGFWFGDASIVLVMALAMLLTLLAAALSGALIPLALQRAGVDPAVASTVFLTTVTDIVGFVTFLGLAWWIVL